MTPEQAITQEAHQVQVNLVTGPLLAAGIAVILAWIVYTTVFKKGK
jgi:hypothetical protein